MGELANRLKTSKALGSSTARWGCGLLFFSVFMNSRSLRIGFDPSEVGAAGSVSSVCLLLMASAFPTEIQYEVRVQLLLRKGHWGHRGRECAPQTLSMATPMRRSI